jgi:hypothetical protein
LDFALEVAAVAPNAEAARRHAAGAQRVWPVRRVALHVMLLGRCVEAIGFRNAGASARPRQHRPRSAFHHDRAANEASQPFDDAQPVELSRGYVRALRVAELPWNGPVQARISALDDAREALTAALPGQRRGS